VESRPRDKYPARGVTRRSAALLAQRWDLGVGGKLRARSAREERGVGRVQTVESLPRNKYPARGVTRRSAARGHSRRGKNFWEARYPEYLDLGETYFQHLNF
jgi:hypothetical protein